MSDIPNKLQAIIDDFALLEGQEKLEYLLELAERRPALPERLLSDRDNMEQVHECMTTVFVAAEKDAAKLKEGLAQLETQAAQVPPQMKKGFDLLVTKARERVAELEAAGEKK